MGIYMPVLLLACLISTQAFGDEVFLRVAPS
jgi:hypothetical protein